MYLKSVFFVDKITENGIKINKKLHSVYEFIMNAERMEVPVSYSLLWIGKYTMKIFLCSFYIVEKGWQFPEFINGKAQRIS